MICGIIRLRLVSPPSIQGSWLQRVEDFCLFLRFVAVWTKKIKVEIHSRFTHLNALIETSRESQGFATEGNKKHYAFFTSASMILKGQSFVLLCNTQLSLAKTNHVVLKIETNVNEEAIGLSPETPLIKVFLWASPKPFMDGKQIYPRVDFPFMEQQKHRSWLLLSYRLTLLAVLFSIPVFSYNHSRLMNNCVVRQCRQKRSLHLFKDRPEILDYGPNCHMHEFVQNDSRRLSRAYNCHIWYSKTFVWAPLYCASRTPVTIMVFFAK